MDTPTPVIPLAYRSPANAPPLPTGVPVELSYAQADAAGAAELAPVLRWHLAVAALCGPAVATCFAVFLNWGPALHLAVYAALLTLATLTGVRMARLSGTFPAFRSTPRMTLDLVAAAALAVVGVGPLVHQVLGVSEPGNWEIAAVGVLAGVLAVTTYRHRLLYGALATALASIGRPKLGRTMRALGWTKLIVESVWLTCCALPLMANAMPYEVMRAVGLPRDGLVFLAVGALFGLPVFGVVWVFMVVVHAIAAVAVRGRATPTAGPWHGEVPAA